MRYQTFARSWPPGGVLVKEPALIPLVGGRNGCEWVSCWKSACQVKALGGSVPSSASVPVPEKPMSSPSA
jgi:hypothetical protein